jgi:phage tail-like protein
MTTAARFAITVDGYEIASFAGIQGVAGVVRPADFTRSGEGSFLQRLSGKENVLTLKDGTSNTIQMWTWHEAARNGLMVAARKSAALVIYDHGRAVARYHLENAWPSDVSIGGLKAGSSEVLMETVTLRYDRSHRLTR